MKAKFPTETRTCPICNDIFIVKVYRKKRCCSPACAYKDPVRNLKNSKTMRKTNLARRKIISDRMKASNPSSNPETVEKIRQTKMDRGILNTFCGTRGGNGHTSRPQALLAGILNWPSEVAVSLGSRQFGYPTNYKIDIGNRKLKIGIEVDGKGHGTKRARAIDKKKEDKLASLGWKILRIKNEDVLYSTNEVLVKIKDFIDQKGCR